MRHQFFSRAQGLAAALLTTTILASCGVQTPTATPSSVATPTGIGTPSAPTSSAAAVAPTAMPVAIASPSARASIQGSPSAAPSSCPPVGAVATVGELLALDAACGDGTYTVRGWWDRPRDADVGPAQMFGAVLRGELPKDRPAPLPVPLPIELSGARLPFASLEGEWVEARISLVPRGAEPHCAWTSPGDASDKARFTWSCPRFGSLTSIKLLKAPSAALRNCPSSTSALPVATFSLYPRTCFGTRTVKVHGWLDTDYRVGGWESSWTIEPGWLWSFAIGRVPVLSPSSNPGDPGAVALHLPPGSASASARQNEWVEIEGHYATAVEAGACRVVSRPGGATADRPSDAEARQDCAQAFIVTRVRPGPIG